MKVFRDTIEVRTEEKLGGKITHGSDVLLEQFVHGGKEPMQQTIPYAIGDRHVEIVTRGRFRMPTLNVEQVVSERLLEGLHAKAGADILDLFLRTSFSRRLHCHCVFPLGIFAKVIRARRSGTPRYRFNFSVSGSKRFKLIHPM